MATTPSIVSEITGSEIFSSQADVGQQSTESSLEDPTTKLLQTISRSNEIASTGSIYMTGSRIENVTILPINITTNYITQSNITSNGSTSGCLECSLSLMLGLGIIFLLILILVMLLCYAKRNWCVEYHRAEYSCPSCCCRTWKTLDNGIDNDAYMNEDLPKGNTYNVNPKNKRIYAIKSESVV